MALVKSTPFAAFPHITELEDGRIVEMCCPHCKGNARARSPNYYFEGLGGMWIHVTRIHTKKMTKEQYLASPGLRVLSQAEIDAIAAGDWKNHIVKRIVVTKDGHDAKQVGEKKDMPILHYPIITIDKHGTYKQLACKFCQGNAQTRAGEDRRADDQKGVLAFYQGRLAIRSHVAQTHGDEVRALGVTTVSLDWVLDNCGTTISKASFDVLRKDIHLRNIAKVKAAVQSKDEMKTRNGKRKIAQVETDGDNDEMVSAHPTGLFPPPQVQFEEGGSIVMTTNNQDHKAGVNTSQYQEGEEDEEDEVESGGEEYEEQVDEDDADDSDGVQDRDMDDDEDAEEDDEDAEEDDEDVEEDEGV